MKSLSYLRDDERRAALTKLGPPPGLKSNVELISAATIEPVPIEWLWNGWLARGRMNVLAGPPGAGKRHWRGMAAIVSTGGLWPDGSQAKQGNVVIWTGEDDPEDTLVPRLIASGADLRGVHFVENIRDEIGSRSFDPAKDMIELSNAIQRCGNVRLVIIDPIAMVATKDSHRNAETRRDLQPVADLGRTTGAAVLGIHHLAKGTGGREPQERLIGSIAFAALPRVVMIAMKLPSEDQGASERRVLMRAKSNIGPDDGGFAYTLSQIELEAHPGVFGSRVVWGTPIEGTAREVLAEAEEMEEERSPREEAVEFLKSLLMNGSVPVTEIHAAARKEGISTATLRRAKAQLGVVSCRIGFGKGSIAQWEISPENSYTLKHPIHAHSNQ